nr:FAD-dependent oxidoreductase [uncultured Sphaerochaeta sp.]
MRSYISETKNTPVVMECDVLVAGGGTAGTIAAIAAARNGAKTVLIERHGHLGGSMVNGAGPLHSFFNLYKAFPETGKIQVVRGIADELIQRMTEAGGCMGHLEQEIGFNYDSVATIIDWEIYKQVIFEMMEEANVHMRLHTWISDVVKEDNKVQGLIVESKSGREAILSKIVIDATGDADVAYLSGAECTNMFPDGHVGMPFGMSNVDIPKAYKYIKEQNIVYSMIHADKDSDYDNIARIGFHLNKLPAFKEFMQSSGLWGPLTLSRHEGDFSFINTTNIKPLDAVNVEEITRAEVILRSQVMKMASLLKENIPGFEHAYVSWTPVHFGVRRTRIVTCEYDISLEEIINGQRFDDEIAVYGFHDMAPKIIIKDGKYYGIPYRALLPKDVENLLVAGRLITSNWEAHMSTRNTVSCMAQGEAVGTAAALCCKQGVTPRKLSVKQLQEQLISQGVFLG